MQGIEPGSPDSHSISLTITPPRHCHVVTDKTLFHNMTLWHGPNMFGLFRVFVKLKISSSSLCASFWEVWYVWRDLIWWKVKKLTKNIFLNKKLVSSLVFLIIIRRQIIRFSYEKKSIKHDQIELLKGEQCWMNFTRGYWSFIFRIKKEVNFSRGVVPNKKNISYNFPVVSFLQWKHF